MNTRTSSKAQPKSIDLLNDLEFVLKKTRFRTLLNRYGFKKTRGTSVVDILMSLFLLPFTRQSLAEGITDNDNVGFGKDALYSLLNNSKCNWRRLLLAVGSQTYNVISKLTDREKVLIIDTTAYGRNRSKNVELLSRVKDHSTKRYVRGFRLQAAAISDGHSLIPVDFSLLASADPKKRFCEMRNDIDKRTTGFRRRLEALQKAPILAAEMAQRIKSKGLRFSYILVDSWYSDPKTVLALHKSSPVICMMKKGRTNYQIDGKKLTLKQIYASLPKRRGRAKILASQKITLTDTVSANIVFVRHNSKRDWLAIMSTDPQLSAEEVVRIYGKRWDIEVFFKMAKQHLRLESEIQSRNFDALIAQISVVFLRYQFMAWRLRQHDDPRTFGQLFRFCSQEVKDITLIESIERILDLVMEYVIQIESVDNSLTKQIKAIFESCMNLFFGSAHVSIRSAPQN